MLGFPPAVLSTSMFARKAQVEGWAGASAAVFVIPSLRAAHHSYIASATCSTPGTCTSGAKSLNPGKCSQVTKNPEAPMCSFPSLWSRTCKRRTVSPCATPRSASSGARPSLEMSKYRILFLLKHGCAGGVVRHR